MAEGVPLPFIKAALEEFSGVPGRFELVRGGQDFAVIVDYAHTPDGLENILHTARKICDNRIITVFGCGGDRDRTKRPIMGRIAAELSDIIVATSDNPRTEDPAFILSQVVEGVEQAAGSKQHEAIIDRREAIYRAVEIATTGDIVVIAGKGHEDYQILKDKTIHFDDKEVAAEAIKAKMGE
jgi:UDP-N-acetylmuramyl-tripeptide synthetase